MVGRAKWWAVLTAAVRVRTRPASWVAGICASMLTRESGTGRDAWKRLGGMDSCTAQGAYLALVSRLDPSWNAPTTTDAGRSGTASETSSAATKRGSAGGNGSGGSGGNGGGMGPVQSTMAHTREVALVASEKTVYHWCQEGDIERVESLLDQGADIGGTDSKVGKHPQRGRWTSCPCGSKVQPLYGL